MNEKMSPITPQTALIYAMVISSAADRDMSDRELQTIGDAVMHLPAFRDFDSDQLPAVAASCADLLAAENGFETVLGLIAGAVHPPLHETAYALAVEVVASDLHAGQEELRVLEMLRHRLKVDRLAAAAIERGAAARYRTPSA